MLSFCGYELELAIEEILERHHDHPRVCAGIDHSGQHWLVVEVDGRAEHLMWLCTPTSPRALSLVVEGKADPADVIRHSSTGWVEAVTVDHGHAVADRRLACTDIPAHWLSATAA